MYINNFSHLKNVFVRHKGMISARRIFEVNIHLFNL